MSAHHTEFEPASQTAGNVVVLPLDSLTITPLLDSCLHAVPLKQLFLALKRLLFSTMKTAKQQSSASNNFAQAEARCPLFVCTGRCYSN